MLNIVWTTPVLDFDPGPQQSQQEATTWREFGFCRVALQFAATPTRFLRKTWLCASGLLPGSGAYSPGSKPGGMACTGDQRKQRDRSPRTVCLKKDRSKISFLTAVLFSKRARAIGPRKMKARTKQLFPKNNIAFLTILQVDS